MKQNLKKVGSVRLTPVKGDSFDIRPSEEGVIKRSKIRNPFGWFLASFYVLFFAVTGFALYAYGKAALEAHYEVASGGYQAFSTAIDAAKEGDFDGASNYLIQSQKAFELLAEETADLRSQTLPSADQGLALEAMDLALDSALSASDLGLQMIEFAKPLESNIKDLLTQIQSPEFGAKMIEFLKEKQLSLNDFRSQMNHIQSNLDQINRVFLTQAMVEKLEEVEHQIQLADELLQQASDFTAGGLKLLGDRVPNRIMVLFQNNREIRGTGGFIGSFSLTDINDGVLGEIKTEDVYRYANQLGLGGDLAELPLAPPGLDQVTSHFSLQDANYSPDLITSAEDIRWFLELAKGPSFDTIVTIDPYIAERVLQLSGNEIVLENLTLKADDLVMRLMYYIESKTLDPANPKGILFELIPEFKERVEAIDSEILQEEIMSMIKARHIQIASFDPQVQSLLEFLGVDGSIPEPIENQDFLAVVSSSSRGNKSDGFVHADFTHETRISANDSLQNSLVISKNHTWGAKETDFWGRWMESYGAGTLSKQELTDILGQGSNLDYMRIYVPLGSKLLSSQGVAMEEIETFEDLEYTVFAFYFPLLAAGEQKNITLEYQLPFTLDPEEPSYQFLARKQAGLKNMMLKKSLNFEGREIGNVFEGNFDQDIEWGVDF